jgi:hypothetical protein
MKRGYDYDYLARRRRELEDAIDEQLQKGKRRYAKRCTQCGGILPYGSNQKLCKACFEKMYGWGLLK